MRSHRLSMCARKKKNKRQHRHGPCGEHIPVVVSSPPPNASPPATSPHHPSHRHTTTRLPFHHRLPSLPPHSRLLMTDSAPPHSYYLLYEYTTRACPRSAPLRVASLGSPAMVPDVGMMTCVVDRGITRSSQRCLQRIQLWSQRTAKVSLTARLQCSGSVTVPACWVQDCCPLLYAAACIVVFLLVFQSLSFFPVLPFILILFSYGSRSLFFCYVFHSLLLCCISLFPVLFFLVLLFVLLFFLGWQIFRAFFRLWYVPHENTCFYGMIFSAIYTKITKSPEYRHF